MCNNNLRWRIMGKKESVGFCKLHVALVIEEKERLPPLTAPK